MSFKEWWKSKPYWLKGSLIGLSVGILIGLPLFIFTITCRSGSCMMGVFPFMVPYYPGMWLFGKIFSLRILSPGTYISGMIFAILCYALIGALIGWIHSIGKRDKKEQA